VPVCYQQAGEKMMSNQLQDHTVISNKQYISAPWFVVPGGGGRENAPEEEEEKTRPLGRRGVLPEPAMIYSIKDLKMEIHRLGFCKKVIMDGWDCPLTCPRG